MISNLVNVDWVNQYSGLQQFAAGLVLGAGFWTLEILRKGKK